MYNSDIFQAFKKKNYLADSLTFWLYKKPGV